MGYFSRIAILFVLGVNLLAICQPANAATCEELLAFLTANPGAMSDPGAMKESFRQYLEKAKQASMKASKVVVLEGGGPHINIGWDYTTEDIVRVISGMEPLESDQGAYLGIGSFHNLDIALARNSEAIVLMDVDKNIVELNRKILALVEKTERFEDMLPALRSFIKNEGLFSSGSFESYIGEGTPLLNRTPVLWAKNKNQFLRLKQLISGGKVAVAHADITDPKTMAPIGRFLGQNGMPLNFVNLSNVENPGGPPDMQSLARIPEAIRAAGGTDTTTLLSAISSNTETEVLGRLNGQGVILKPSVARVTPTGGVFTFSFSSVVRRLSEFTPIYVPTS